MKILPLLVLFVGIGIGLPKLYYFTFYKKTIISKISIWPWILTGFIAFLFFPIFLFRKHWEKALLFVYNKFWFVVGVVQMDNNFWETLAKLLVIVILIALTQDKGKEIFKQKNSATIFGYWVGLCYGIGEALTLAIIGYLPILNRIFGINLFMYFTTWYSVWERAYAVQIHAIIGGLVGLGFYHYFGLTKKWWLLFFFIIGILYHELVDGLVLVLIYFPSVSLVKFFSANIYSITLPILLIIGYLILLLAYKATKPTFINQTTEAL